MKYTRILMIVLAIGCWATAFLQTPIMKWPTHRAVERIESDFIRSDLTEDERRQLDFNMQWIQSNQSASYSAFQFTLGSLAVLAAFVVVQNIYLLRTRKQKKTE